MPRRRFSSRLSRYEVIPHRIGYCPVVSAVREGEQMGELL